MDLKTVSYLILALFAFAANSVLCRLALGNEMIDPASFTVIRLMSGALTLGVILLLRNPKLFTQSASRGSWSGAISLFVYAVSFSYAYMTLSTGTGALVLFGTVQVTMIVAGIMKGHKITSYELAGVVLAFAGMTYLMFPSLAKPSFTGFLLMFASGIAWGIYTLIGQRSQAPLNDTGFNFIRCVPLAFMLLIFSVSSLQIQMQGVLLAVLSGALASGVGYAIWYKVLPKLRNSVAAVSQLSVPIIAAVGGLIWVAEPFTLRLMISSALVLGGIALVISTKNSAKLKRGE